jgi:hypothetical protein
MEDPSTWMEDPSTWMEDPSTWMEDPSTRKEEPSTSTWMEEPSTCTEEPPYLEHNALGLLSSALARVPDKVQVPDTTKHKSIKTPLHK